jgi:hypothetical protein
MGPVSFLRAPLRPVQGHYAGGRSQVARQYLTERFCRSMPVGTPVDVSSWPILLQKSAVWVGPIFSGPWRRPSKKHVGVHSNDRSHHQGLRQPRYNAIEQRLLIVPALASIFDTPNFSTFATESARCCRRRQGRHVRTSQKLTLHIISVATSPSPPSVPTCSAAPG